KRKSGCDRSQRAYHAVAGRDGACRKGDEKTGFPDTLAHRRRDDIEDAHRGKDRSRIREWGGPCVGRLAERHGCRLPAECRAKTGIPCDGEKRIPEAKRGFCGKANDKTIPVVRASTGEQGTHRL